MPVPTVRSDILIRALVEHWERQARKLTQAGVPVEEVTESMRTAALLVEHNCFAVSLLDTAKDRIVAVINKARAEAALTAEAHHP